MQAGAAPKLPPGAWSEELAGAWRVAFPLGVMLWWLSRGHHETAHLVDLMLEFVLDATSIRWPGLGPWTGAGSLAMASGVLALVAVPGATALGLCWRRWRSGPRALCLRQGTIQLFLSLALWLLIEIRTVAYEASAFGWGGMVPAVAASAIVAALLLLLPVGLLVRWRVGGDPGDALLRSSAPLGRGRRGLRWALALLPVVALACLFRSVTAPPAGRGAEPVA